MVKASFARLANRLTEERNMKIVTEGIIPEVGRTNSARHNGEAEGILNHFMFT